MSLLDRMEEIYKKYYKGNWVKLADKKITEQEIRTIMEYVSYLNSEEYYNGEVRDFEENFHLFDVLSILANLSITPSDILDEIKDWGMIIAENTIGEESGDCEQFVLRPIADNPNCSPKTLDDFSDFYCTGVLSSVARNPNTLPETLQKMRAMYNCEPFNENSYGGYEGSVLEVIETVMKNRGIPF
jgi:hypothetical protein